MVNWARLPSGNTFAPHYHEDMQEIFVILSGQHAFVWATKSARCGRGDAVLIDPREVHQMWNDGSDDVEYLAIGIAGGEHGRTMLTTNSL